MKTLIQRLALVRSLGLSSLVVSGCVWKDETPTANTPEPFRSALVEYQRKSDHEDECNLEIPTYMRRSTRLDAHGNIVKIVEMEITCENGYVPAIAQSSRFVVASRDLFPDGRVNVTWDPGNKYKSISTRVE